MKRTYIQTLHASITRHGRRGGGGGGGGATHFKEHLAGRGRNVVSCTLVSAEVRDYFRRELDKTTDKRRGRQQERLRREEITAEGDVDDEDDEELQRALHESQEEEAYARRVREQGGQYEPGGGSSQPRNSEGGGLMGMLKRSVSRKEKGEKVQTRIDTGPWTAKSKLARRAIGKAWSKWFLAEAIPGKKADSPYFTSAVKETQRWGKFISLVCNLPFSL
ncbi:hypothetical protein PR202_ga15295 [Eleusine coracana subsp. coracana]|uniref:Uncharacterized protein n=1 Tax=Eleusine coracana subsp. coracana TaxID=191504 RepID=A0AAV5CJH6_ELECO|nr:hypothetical protein PR202_ga15295 [Eleusine coracana subsp. coracana]